MLRNRISLVLLYCVFVLPIFSTPIFGQEAIDQIEQLIESDSLQFAIDKAEGFLTQNTDHNQRGRLRQLQADAYYYLNDIQSSLDHYLLGIAEMEKAQTPNLHWYQECYSHTGFCYRELGAYDKALSYYHRALDLSVENVDSVEMAVQYANLGSTYGKLGDIDEATQYHLKAYAIDLLKKDTAALGFDLRNIASLKIALGEHEEAVSHIRESIRLLKLSQGNPNSLALRYGALGRSFLETGAYDSASYYLNESLQAHIDQRDSIHIAFRWIDLSKLATINTQHATSVELASSAKQYFKSIAASQHEVIANLALIFALQKQGKYQRALELSDENIALCQQHNLLIELKNTYQEKIDILKTLSRYKESIGTYTLFNQLKDSLLNIENKKATALLEVKYDVFKREQENQLLTLENQVNQAKINRQTLKFNLVVMILAIILIATAVITWMTLSKQKLKHQLLQTEINELRTYLKASLEGDASDLQIDREKINEISTAPLSDREFEILNFALTDLSNGEIAEKAFVSVNTVKYHLKNVYEKLGVGNRKEALQFALQSSM